MTDTCSSCGGMEFVLMITDEDTEQIEAIKALAVQRPVDVRTLEQRLSVRGEGYKFAAQLREQTVVLTACIPFPLVVTYSVQVGQTIGTARHLALTIQSEPDEMDGQVAVAGPSLCEALMPLFGFVGGVGDCVVYECRTPDGAGSQLNLVQGITEVPSASATRH